MATVNDIGVPGQPATNLTAWQAAVRDAINKTPRVAAGMATTAANGQAVVVFPAGMFTTPPVVVATKAGAGNFFVSTNSPTATGVTLYLTKPDGITPQPSGDIFWIATAGTPTYFNWLDIRNDLGGSDG